MSEEESVRLHISSKAVHNAVRNILVNEMGITREVLIGEVMQKMEGASDEAAKRIVERAEKRIDERVDRVFSSYSTMQMIERELKSAMRDVLKTTVHNEFNEQFDDVIKAVFRDGVEVRYGWKQRVAIVGEKPEDKKG
jgi:methionyl-tRNA synthetase